MKYQKLALELLSKGVVCVPFTEKSRCLVPWQRFQTEMPTVEETTKMFAHENVRYLALICRDGIEAIDVDCKNQEEGQDIWKEYVDHLKFYKGGEETLKKVLVEKTKSNGYHLIYKCSVVEGNQKLANTSDKKVVLETRGTGGLLFIAPSEGYKLLRHSFLDIPVITEDERELLLNVARSCDRTPKKEDVKEIEIIRKEQNTNFGSDSLKSWDDYDSKNHVLALIRSNGWTELTRESNSTWIYFNRPGAKNKGKIDASWNRHSKFFYNFSGSDYNFDGDKGYSPTSIFAILNHGGNYAEACKELYRLGYGDRIESEEIEEDLSLTATYVEENTNTYDFLKSTSFDIHEDVVESEACLTVEVENRIYKVASFGMLGAIVGPKKSGKSLITSAVAASGISGERKLNFLLDRMGRSMEFHDTEQSKEFFQITQKRIFKIAGITENLNYYNAYHSRRLSPDERFVNIKRFVYENKELGILFIDGIVDLMVDYNDMIKSKNVINELMKWADELNILIITVLHLTKTTGTMRGHLGTELENKCDFSIQVEENEGTFRVSSRDSRYRPFKSFEFDRHEDDGMPVFEGKRIDDRDGDLTIEDLELVAEQKAVVNYDTIPDGIRGNDEDVPF